MYYMDEATSRHEWYEKFMKGFGQKTFKEQTTWKTQGQMAKYSYME